MLRSCEVAARAGLVVIVAASIAACSKPAAPPTQPCTASFVIPPPPSSQFVGNDVPAVSPDGSRAAFAARDSRGAASLWIYALQRSEPGGSIITSASAAPRVLSGTDDAALPFWSPDGRSLGYFAHGALKIIDVDSAAVRDVTSVDAPRSASWTRADQILFSNGARGIFVVAAGGGTPRKLTTPDPERAETAHIAPLLLPDGRHFLYTVVAQGEYRGVYIGSLTSVERTPLTVTESQALYSSTGAVFTVKDNALWSRSVSLTTMLFTQPREFVAQPIQMSESWLHPFSMSRDGGVVVFRQAPASSIVWIDQRGNAISELPDHARYIYPRVSPDGNRIAVSMVGIDEVFVYSRPTDKWQRVSDGTGRSTHPVWLQDSKQLAFTLNNQDSATTEVRVVQMDDPKASRVMTTLPYNVLVAPHPESISRDGMRLAIVEYGGPPTDLDVRVVSLQGTGTLEQRTVWRAHTHANEGAPSLSPDGRWLAFVARANTGEPVEELFAVDLASPSNAAVSLGVGSEPVWSTSGSELFYRSGNSIAVLSTSGPVSAWRSTSRAIVSGAQLAASPGIARSLPNAAMYDVLPSGRVAITRNNDNPGLGDYIARIACRSAQEQHPSR